MNYRSKKGFTLVEIMIVVVIIGLLAAMAIPAFQKVRQNSMHSRMDNDARNLGSAAQQYFLDTNNTTIAIAVNASGVVTNALSSWCKKIGTGYQLGSDIVDGGTFTIAHPLAASTRTYNSEGQFLHN